jgi:pre-mRNA-splicing helicase BRR2
VKGLLEIVTAASEFEDIPIRHREDIILRKLYDHVPVKLPEPDFDSPHHKANILLQAHFSRLTLPADLASDQARILSKILSVLSAAVDVLSSSGYLNALKAMELSQMCVQAVWDRDSPLKQIPHFSSAVLARCKEAGVDSVFDLTELEDKERNQLLQFSNRQLEDVRRFVDAYPR